MLIRGGYDGLVVLAAITRFEKTIKRISQAEQDKTGQDRGQGITVQRTRHDRTEDKTEQDRK